MDIPHEILFYAVVWATASLAGCSRCIYNGQYKSVSHLLSVGGVSGFLGFAIVAICASDYRSPDFNCQYWLGISTIVGLAGKEKTQLISVVWKKLLLKIK